MRNNQQKRSIRTLVIALAMMLIIGGVSQFTEVYAADIDGIRMDNWMQYMPDNAPISQLNLPGTHDAGTAYVPRLAQYWARCQRKNITEQLDAGIRILDVRCGLLDEDGEDGYFMIDPKGTKIVGPERMGINHAGIVCYRTSDLLDFRFLTLETIMKDVDKFLAAHPSETVVMLVADEVQINVPGTSAYEKEQKQIIRNSLNVMKKQLEPGREINEGDKWARFDFYSKEAKVPQLGDTRGRCVMFDDMGTYTGYETHYRGEDVTIYSHQRDLTHVSETAQTQVYGTDTAKFWEQDYKNWEKEGEPDIKWVTSSMNNEGVGGDIFEKGGSIFFQTPLAMANSMNPFLLTMKMPVTKRFGWLMMDFPTGDNIRHVIESNMGYTSMQLVFDFRDLMANDSDAHVSHDVIDRIYRYSDNYEKETIMLEDLEKNHQVTESDSDGVLIYNICGLDMKDDKGADWHYSYGVNPNGIYRITKAQEEPAVNDYEHPTDDHGHWTTRQVYYKADMGQKDHLTEYSFPIVWRGETEISGKSQRPETTQDFIDEYGGIVLEQTDPIRATNPIEIKSGEPSDDPDEPYFTYPANGDGKIVVHNLEKYDDYNYKYLYSIKGTIKSQPPDTRYTASVGTSISSGKFLLMNLTNAEYPFALVKIDVNHYVNTTSLPSTPGFNYTLSLVSNDGQESVIATKYAYFTNTDSNMDFSFEEVRFDEPGTYTLKVRTTEKNFVDAWSHDVDAKEIKVEVWETEDGGLEGKQDTKPSIWHDYKPLVLNSTFINKFEGGKPENVSLHCGVYKEKNHAWNGDIIKGTTVNQDDIDEDGKTVLTADSPITEPGTYNCMAVSQNNMNGWVCEDDHEYFDFVVDFNNDGKLVVVGKNYEEEQTRGTCDLGPFEFTHRNLKELIDIKVNVEFEEYESVRENFDGSVDIKLEQVNGPENTFEDTLSEDNSWTTTFTDLPKYAILDNTGNGPMVDYELVDYGVIPEEIENYDVRVNRNSFNEFTVTYVANRPSLETIDVKATIKWDDNGKILKRPAKVNTYIVTEGDYDNRTVYPAYALSGWTTEWKGAAKYGFDPRGESAKDVHLMKYTLAADPVPGYEGPVITGSQDDGFTVTYTLKEKKKDDDVVDTGDHSDLSLMLIIMVGAILSLAGLVKFRKKFIK